MTVDTKITGICVFEIPLHKKIPTPSIQFH
jgi:hypothetical protein